MTITVTIDLPEPFVQQLTTTAHARHRSIEEVAREILLRDWAVPLLPSSVETELAAFGNLSDDTLWLLARGTLTPAEQTALSNLNQIAKQRQMTYQEQERQQALLDAYDRMVVRRAHAAQILMERGYNLSDPHILQPV